MPPLCMPQGTREVGVIAFIDLSGRIALGEGSALLRKTIPRSSGRTDTTRFC